MTFDDLLAKVAELEARVAALEAREAPTQPARRISSADKFKAVTVADILEKGREPK